MNGSSSSYPQRIGIYGTGRVATALLQGLVQEYPHQPELIGRDPERSQKLGKRFGIERVKSPGEADPDLELLLVAVSDDAVEKAVQALPKMNGVIAHCSGSLSLSVLEGNGSGQGVFYPVQSFSQEALPDWKKIPICVEGNDERSTDLLKNVARHLSDTVHSLNGEERKVLHLAAVFACNFTNHFYGIAQSILEERGLSFELLHSLILHTAQKGVEEDPRSVQTGPAARGDKDIMEEHMGMLDHDPELKELYRKIGQRIMEEHHGTSEL